MKRCSVVMQWMVMLCIPVITSCSSADRDVRGTVTVNGEALEMGTISFQPSEGGGGKGAGAAIDNGRFELPARLPEGAYSVTVDGFEKTGRMVSDPQRGKVAESVQLRFQGLPLPVKVTAESADNTQIELKTVR